MPDATLPRRGIAAGGNWIVDWIKTVDRLPGRGMLGNIVGASRSTGGAPANVLADLARLGSPFPLWGVGVVGDDPNGHYILDTFRDLRVDVSFLRQTTESPTSYTDVMNEAGTGVRTFFHCRGANALFGPEQVPVASLACRIFHLGYLLLLDGMDAPDAEFGTCAARLLHGMQAAGVRTSVDVVSEESDRFGALVPPALRHVDYLILNEIEATRAVGGVARDARGRLDGPAVLDAVEELAARGGTRLIAVHMPEGVLLRDAQGRRFARGALDLPDGYIRSTVGAGDAFCAGMLYAIHEEWDIERAAHLGGCCAAATLASDGASEGMRPLDEVLALGVRFGERDPPLDV